MTAAAVQTRAPGTEQDMFGETPAAHPHQVDDVLITITGTLVHAAEVRTKPVGDGTQSRPVLCLDVAPLNKGLRRRIHVEQIFTEATRKNAEARAAELKRGAQVTFTTALTDMRVLFPHVRSVQLTPTSGSSS